MLRRFPTTLLSGTSSLKRGYVSLKLAVLSKDEHASLISGTEAAQKRLESNPRELLRFLHNLSEATTSSWAPRIHNYLPQENVDSHRQVLEWEAEILEILKPITSVQPKFPILNMAEGQKVRALVQNILNLYPTYGGLITPNMKDVADPIFVKASVRSIFESYFATGYKIAPNQRQLRFLDTAMTGVVNVGLLREVKTRTYKTILEEDVSKLNGEELLAMFEVNWAAEPFKKSASLEHIRNRFEAILMASLSKPDPGFYKTEQGLQVVPRKLETKTFVRLVARICDKHCSPSLIKLIDQYIRQNAPSFGSEDLTMSLYGLARNTVNELHLDWVNNKLPSLVINNSGCFALVVALAAKLYEVTDTHGQKPFFPNQETFVKFLHHMEGLIELQDTLASRYNSRYLLVAIEKLANLRIDRKLIPANLIRYLANEFRQHQDSYESLDDQIQMTYFLIELGVLEDFGRVAQEAIETISDFTNTTPEKTTLSLWLLYRIHRLKQLPVPKKIREIVAVPLSRDHLKKSLDTDRLRRRLNEVTAMEAEYQGEKLLSDKELAQEEMIAKALWNSKSYARTGWVVQQDLRASRQQIKTEEEKPRFEEVEFTLAPEPEKARKPLRFERSWRDIETESEDD